MTDQKINIHQKTFAIEWGHMDALGHVNNTRYFDYFQETRIEWLASLEMDMQQREGPVVIHISGTFLKPIVYPATITLTSTIHSLGRSSVIIDHEIVQNKVVMAEGSCKIVWVDYRENKAIPLPEKIRNLFNPN